MQGMPLNPKPSLDPGYDVLGLETLNPKPQETALCHDTRLASRLPADALGRGRRPALAQPKNMLSICIYIYIDIYIYICVNLNPKP